MLELLGSFWNSLPVKLLLIQIRRHYLLLFLWYVLFKAVAGDFWGKLGMPYLFLDAEYLSKVNFLSFLIVGIFLGVFIIAYMAVLYVSHSTSLPFLATLKRPFLRFFLNAFPLPFSFLVFYSIKLYQFQILHENLHPLINVCALLLGCFFAITICFIYFFSTQFDFQKIISKGFDYGFKNRFFLRRFLIRERKIISEKTVKIDYWKVSWLFTNFYKIKHASGILNTDLRTTRLMFRQNQISIISFQLIVIAFLVILSVFSETVFLKIPAAATLMVIFTLICLILSAFNFWFGVWQTTAIVILAFFVNSISQFIPFYGSSYAYGLNYSSKMEEYSVKRLQELNNNESVQASIDSTLVILNNWKSRSLQNHEKPVLNLLCVSGGGLRSSLFTFLTLQQLQDSTQNTFFNSVGLISGASGGILGAAYFRELQLRKLVNGTTIKSSEASRNISSDMLNPIGFYMVVNDILPFNIKIQRSGYTYPVDRGLAFENALSANTDDVLNKKVTAYKEDEKQAKIPMLLITPTISNDIRSMIISPQPVGWLIGNEFNYPDGFEYYKLFEKLDADRLNMLTALRMNATFPYITPYVALPTNPIIKVMDAGLRDNFGTMHTIKFLNTFNDWINENTSAVNIVMIRDTHIPLPISNEKGGTISNFVISPVNTLYSNWQTTQDYRFQREFGYLKSKFKIPFEVITFQYQAEKSSETVSLSWHLTKHEKDLIRKMTSRGFNQTSLKKIQKQLRPY